MKRLLLTALLVLTGAMLVPAADWPQWRGPRRDGKSTETGLLKTWPTGGPRLLWSNTSLAPGFSPVTIAHDTIYVTGNDGGQGVLFALDLTGKLKWQQPYGQELPKSDKYAPSRNAPTVAGDLLYLMSSMGDLVCLEAKTGIKKWGYNVLEKFKGQNIKWKICESLLVDGDKLYVTPGGEAGIVALNRHSGAVLWKSALNDNSAYCSPILMPVGSRQILVQMMASSFAAVDPQDGKPLWRQPFQSRHSVHANTPVFAGNIVFSTAGYGHGGVAMKVSADGRTATEAYVNKDFAVHHGGQVLVDGHVYAATDKGAMCMELATGRTKWGPEPAISKGSITFADGLLYCYSENGKLSLVKASPQSCEIISSFPITQGSGTHWAHPVIAGGRLYIRHGEALLAYEIKAN